MPMEDAIRHIYRDFKNKTKDPSRGVYQHPDTVQTLFNSLGENRSLTVSQYDHLITYMSGRREVQRKTEIGEDTSETELSFSSGSYYAEKKIEQSKTTHDDLQRKILQILNKKPMIMQVAKQVEMQPKPMTQIEKDELKNFLMKDDKVKQVINSLRTSKKV
jgi:hypothetical protein